MKIAHKQRDCLKDISAMIRTSPSC